jgi:hypothetical protein
MAPGRKNLRASLRTNRCVAMISLCLAVASNQTRRSGELLCKSAIQL